MFTTRSVKYAKVEKSISEFKFEFKFNIHSGINVLFSLPDICIGQSLHTNLDSMVKINNTMFIKSTLLS